ncbi:unnamed protein product [Schistocephalus solidus]|uniref:Serine hydrolase domain-containing protein n=1 Tax=Schistocephalus solidus TaxID=70667 RepID=A0A3P7F4E9_SCHSO|nr:unnamed protein product [Schistocephalus solidus]
MLEYSSLCLLFRFLVILKTYLDKLEASFGKNQELSAKSSRTVVSSVTVHFRLCISIVNVVFIDAPLTIPDVGDNVQGLGWWFSREDNTFKAQENTDYLCGFDKSVSTVKEALRSQSTFHPVLALVHPNSEWDAPKVEFCILVAPFKSRCSLHSPLYALPIQMPTLIVYGLDDKVIPADMTKDLLDVYEPPHTTLVHAGGHLIPTNAEAKIAYRSFLDRFRSKT